MSAKKSLSPFSRLSIIVILLLAFIACFIGVSGNVDSIQTDDVSNADKIPDKNQRIALLILDLQDVDAHPMMSPGYIDFNESPIVQALVQEGEDAVDPLLDCLEHDQRLTRSSDDWRDRHRMVGVEEPAFAAIQAILKTRAQFPSLQEPYSNFSPGGAKLERVALAAQIRAYWNKIRGKTLPQRWYASLSDDQARPEAWAEAADDIVMPDNATYSYGSGSPVFATVQRPHQPAEAEPIVFRGEVLRSETNPSVSELLVKRLRESVATVKDQRTPFPMESPRKLAGDLARWDGKNQIETLRWYCGVLQKIILTETANNGPGTIDDLIGTYLERVEAGDAQALGDYAQWIRTADAHKLDKLTHLYGARFFAPVWSYPDDPAMVATAAWLFQDSGSPWSLCASGIDPTWVATSTHLPLVAVPAFRALLLQQLENKQVVGSVKITPPNNIMVTFVYGNGYRNTDPDAPPAPFTQDLRLCDMIAYRVSQIQGAPRCEPYWATERRDRAILETTLFLQRYGDRLAHQTTSQEGNFPHLEAYQTSLHFPPLVHPANQDDVAAGRAIFSLEGKGERKVLPLPEVPQRAQWITLKDYPTMEARGAIPLANTFTKVKGYDQDGMVWQAEDVLIDGKRQYYFGFVGKHGLAAVPGDEIQFESTDRNESIDHWGFRVDLLENGNPPGWVRRITGKLGEPLTTKVWVKNLRGIERALAKSVRVPGTTSADDLGLEIHLAYCPRQLNSMSFPLSPAEWEPLAAKVPVQVDLSPTPATLAPLEEDTLLQLDLAKWYDLKLPGSYLLGLKFKKGGLLDSEVSISQDFELTE